jgi:hypothetical protein
MEIEGLENSGGFRGCYDKGFGKCDRRFEKD